MSRRPEQPAGDELALADLYARRDHAVVTVDQALTRSRQASRSELVDALLEVRHALAPTPAPTPGPSVARQVPDG